MSEIPEPTAEPSLVDHLASLKTSLLGRQVGSENSALPHDHSSLLLPPEPELVSKAAVTLAYRATTHVECEWHILGVLFLPVSVK